MRTERDEPTGTAAEVHTYECPECDCRFERRKDEPEVCRCPECGCEVDTEEVGCACCR